ncbi:MAG: hypothetical protein ACYTHJ_01625 [Planctomycetota bacterium]|jgi:hypothetical protein
MKNHHTANTTPAALEGSLARRLDQLASRLRWFVFVQGLAVVLAVFVVSCAVQFVLDYWLHGIRVSVRAAMLAGVLGVTGWVATRHLLRPLRSPMGRPQVANLIERSYPQLSSTLISAVRFSMGEVGEAASNSRDMVKAVIDAAAQRVSHIDFMVVLDRNRMRQRASIVAVVIVLVGLIGGFAPESFRVGIARNILLQDVDWPRRTRLVVDSEDGVIRAARGDDVVIEARAEGVQPRSVEIFFQTASGTEAREPMFTVGSADNYRYRFTMKSAEEDFQFYLEGGDDKTQDYQVTLVDRPRVVATSMLIKPPSYAGLSELELADGQRSTQVLPGSEVIIRATTNKPIVAASLRAGTEDLAGANVEGSQCVASFTAMKTRTCHFELLDEVDLQNRHPVRFSIRVLKDEAPRVKLSMESVGDMITPEAVLPLEVTFQDRYGIALAELNYQVLREGESTQKIFLPGFEAGTKSFLASVKWPASGASVLPGDRLSIQARASDFDDVLGPNHAQSAENTIRVVTRDELLAELARREQEYRQTFERLVDNQEQLRGKLLSVKSDQDSGETFDASGRLATLERQQRNITSSLNMIRQQFYQILTQLEINGLDTRDERERLEVNILVPLDELAKRDLIDAADSIRAWSRKGDQGSSARVDKLQVAVLKKMRSVLANMLQWEGYHEVVTMLRDIIRLQRELGDESQDALLKDADDVFDD